MSNANEKTDTQKIADALAAAIDRHDGSLELVAAVSVIQLRKS